MRNFRSNNTGVSDSRAHPVTGEKTHANTPAKKATPIQCIVIVRKPAPLRNNPNPQNIFIHQCSISSLEMLQWNENLPEGIMWLEALRSFSRARTTRYRNGDDNLVKLSREPPKERRRAVQIISNELDQFKVGKAANEKGTGRGFASLPRSRLAIPRFHFRGRIEQVENERGILFEDFG